MLDGAKAAGLVVSMVVSGEEDEVSEVGDGAEDVGAAGVLLECWGTVLWMGEAGMSVELLIPRTVRVTAMATTPTAAAAAPIVRTRTKLWC